MNPLATVVRAPVWGTLVLLVAASTTSCGVSKSKYLDVTKQHEQCQADLTAANKDKAQLESEKAALDARAKETETAAQQLQDQLDAQKKQTDETKATYESLVGKLQGELNSGQVEIQQLRDVISVNLAQDILFPSGSAQLDKTGSELLLKVAEELKSSPFKVVVTGHTDDQKIGKALSQRYPTNWELGGARAARIVRLFEEAGIPKERMASVSFADSRPREGNDTPEGRTKNRRIEIKLRPATSDDTAVN